MHYFVKIGSLSFFSSDIKTFHHILDATILALILHLSFFKCFAFFKFAKRRVRQYGLQEGCPDYTAN